MIYAEISNASKLSSSKNYEEVIQIPDEIKL